MEAKFNLLELIENVKANLNSKQYKDILDTISKIPDIKSNTNRKDYTLEILKISPVIIEDQDGLTLTAESEILMFNVMLTEESFNRISPRDGVCIESLTDVRDELDQNILKNIQSALQQQSTDEKFIRPSEMVSFKTFIEHQYIIKDIYPYRHNQD